MRRLSVPFLALASVLSFISARPVFAGALVNSIPISQAQGGGAQLSVWPGSGTNIDFTRTGEVIQRVWLDDPSRLTIDFDGNLGGGDDFGGGGGGGGSGGAGVIHLRRVTGISFSNLPQTASTLLTAVTQGSDGSRHVYQFQVNYGSGTPQYATVALMPSSTGTDTSNGGGLVVSSGRTATLSDIERGLQQAISQNLIAASSPVVARTQDFLARARNGTAMQSAADEANISMAVVSQLATMGMSTLSRPTLLRPDSILPSDSTTPANPATPIDTELSATPAAPL